MNCQHITDQFPDFLIGDLGEDEKKRIQSHIADCPSCREELESLSAVWTKLGVLPEERPSPSLRTNFYAMLEKHQNETAEIISGPGIVARLQTWLKSLPAGRPVFQLSMSLILLVIGLAAGAMFTSRTGNPVEIAQLHQEVQSMRQALAVSLLEKTSAVDRLQGVNLSYDMESPDSSLLAALIKTVNTDPNINVRLAAVDSLFLFYDNPVVNEAVASLLVSQTSPLVQVALIDLVVSMRERRAVDSLKKIIQSDTLDPDVRKYAELGLQKIGI